MNRKKLLIPVYTLAEPREFKFIEFYVEPPADDKQYYYQAIAGMGLDRAISCAEKVYRKLPDANNSGAIYPAHRLPLLENVNGIALGFVLSRFMLEINCPFNVLIVEGLLDLDRLSFEAIQIKDSSSYRLQILQAINKLEWTSEKTALILPFISDLNGNETKLLNQIEKRGIKARFVKTLADAVSLISPLPTMQKNQLCGILR